MKAQDFADAMNALHLPGYTFRPIYYTPYYGPGKGKELQGVQVYITDVVDCDLTLIQFYAIEVLANMYKSRKNHKLDEWRDFCAWIKTLPYQELITGEEK